MRSKGTARKLSSSGSGTMKSIKEEKNYAEMSSLDI